MKTFSSKALNYTKVMVSVQYQKQKNEMFPPSSVFSPPFSVLIFYTAAILVPYSRYSRSIDVL